MKMLIQLFVVLFFFLQPVIAKDGSVDPGRSIGPRGGMITQLVPDRNQPGIWWAVNDGKLYRSVDDARSWRMMMDGVSAIALRPQTSEIIAASWNSENQVTEIWHARKSANRFSRIGRSAVFPREIHFDSFDQNVLYIFNGSQFAFSRDFGRSWTTQEWRSYTSETSMKQWVSKSCGTSSDVYGFISSPVKRRVLYVWGFDDFNCTGFALESNNFGKTWFPSRFPTGNFHFDPLFPDRAYSANFQGVSELTKEGWKFLSNTPMTSVASVPGDRKHLYGIHQLARNAFSLLESFDGGRNWREREKNNHSPSEWAVADDDSKSIVLGTFGGGIYKRSAPRWWRTANQGFQPGSATLITRGDDPETVYTLIGDQFLYRKDGSRSYWNSLFFGLPFDEDYNLLVANPQNGSHLFIGSNSSTAVSFNGGTRWKESKGLGNDGVDAIAFDTRNSRLVYALRFGTIYESEDGGMRFRKLPASFESDWGDTIALNLNPSDSRTAYAISSLGIKKTIDRWQSVSNVAVPGMGEIAAGVLIDDDRLVIIKESGELFRSVDGGANWERLSVVPGETWRITKLLSADSAGKHLYLLMPRYSWEPKEAQLIESTNFGVTWSDAGRRLGSNTTIFDITDPKFRTIYLATDKGVIE